MKRVPVKYVSFLGEDNDDLIIRHSNRGEPYREGIELTLPGGSIFLEEYEALQLRDLMNRLYPAANERRELLQLNLNAWEDEEDSVQEEHAGLIEAVRSFLER